MSILHVHITRCTLLAIRSSQAYVQLQLQLRHRTSKQIKGQVSSMADAAYHQNACSACMGQNWQALRLQAP